MRAVPPLLLFLFAVEASADCTARILLTTSEGIKTAHVDRGTLYFSLPRQSVIRRLDQATGETSPFFTAGANLDDWDIENGTLALLVSSQLVLVSPNGSRRVVWEPAANARFQLYHGHLYWLDGSDLRRVDVNGGPIETVATALPIESTFRYIVFEERLIFSAGGALYWQTFGGAPVLLQPNAGQLNAVTDDAIYTSMTTWTDPHIHVARVFRVPWSGAPLDVVYKTGAGYDGTVSTGAAAAGATLYIISDYHERIGPSLSSLSVMRGGTVHCLASTSLGSFHILAADEEQIVVIRFTGATQRIERFCAALHRRARAVR